jgi:aryl-alcohol dehydrogenase-like predicted oxidoreductase
MPSRREFLRLTAAAAAAAGVAGPLARAALALDAEARRRALEKPLPRRPLGKTGMEVGILGLGCFYLGSLPKESEAVAIVRRARELGMNWFDTAPSYAGGVSEERLGKGLEGARDGVFVATKSTCRDGKSALAELEASLKRLGTDHVDLFQFHALRTAQDVAQIFGEGGAHEALARAKQAGKVRHLGFTGHFDPDLLARVCRERPLETMLLPLNCLDPHERSFEKGTLPAAAEKGMGVIAMKVFVSGRLVADRALSPAAEECVRYSLSLPISTAIVGCASLEELETDLAAAKTFEPMPEPERKALAERVRPFLASKIEWYKR